MKSLTILFAILVAVALSTAPAVAQDPGARPRAQHREPAGQLQPIGPRARCGESAVWHFT